MAPAEIFDFQARQTLTGLQAEIGEIKARLNGRDGDGGMASEKDDLTDHKIALSEARQETKLTRLEGKIDLLSAAVAGIGPKIDSQRTEASAGRNLIIVTVIGTALTAVALIFAILSYGAATFVNGTTVRDIVQKEVSSAGVGKAATPSK